jgi:[ribosomal protein S5]-alanine N-acetyltransferase
MIELKDGNVLLRSLIDSDKSRLAELANNKRVWDSLRDYMPYPYSEQDAVNFIAFVAEEDPPCTFAIVYNNEFCGVTGLIPQKDIYRISAEIGYWLGEPYWRKGITTRAVKLITHYGLHELNFTRLHAGVFEYNLGSMKVLEKNGYVKEGVFRKALIKNDRIWDEHRYAILR